MYGGLLHDCRGRGSGYELPEWQWRRRYDVLHVQATSWSLSYQGLSDSREVSRCRVGDRLLYADSNRSLLDESRSHLSHGRSVADERCCRCCASQETAEGNRCCLVVGKGCSRGSGYSHGRSRYCHGRRLLHERGRWIRPVCEVRWVCCADSYSSGCGGLDNGGATSVKKACEGAAGQAQ